MTPSRLILLNGTRPNLIATPEAFDDASWAKTAASVTANATEAPNGTTTADKLIATAVLGQHRLNYTPTSFAGSQTLSVHLKAAEYAYAMLRIGTLGAFIISLSDGVVTGSEASAFWRVIPKGNGWYRYAITVTAAANDVARINALETTASIEFTGDGVKGIYVWGAKLEQAPSMSRY